jgi:hypothetical protein
MATENVGVKEPAQKDKKKNLFGAAKTPDQIIYRLLKRNDKLRNDTPPYPPYRRFPNTDIIKWEEGTRAIRYLPGFTSIFVDEQEAGNRVIPDNVLNNPNNRFEIIDGDIKVRPHEKTKLMFLDYCNRNSESPYRTGQQEALFARYSEEKTIDNLADKQEKQQEAMEKAFGATEEQMAFHAKYLGINMIDGVTQATRTLKAIKTDYRQYAFDNPEKFISTFDDGELKDKYVIEKAIENKIISLDIVPGKAAWTSSKEEICDMVAGITPVESLFNFSKLKAGEAMMKRLRELI